MKVQIIYATYSSGTLLVSEIIAKELMAKNHSVDIVNVADVEISSLNSYDLVLLGSPSWFNNKKDGQPHHLYYEFMTKLDSQNFQSKHFAVFGLGDNAYARLCGAVDVLEEFVLKHYGKLVVDSLRIDSFYFDREKNNALAIKWAQSLTP